MGEIYIRVMLVTSCGAKKDENPQPAGRLYKSSRIRHLYRRSKELRVPFYILSAKYGLISADTVIKPYDKVMTPERAAELLPQVKETLKSFDLVIFYKGGARKEYRELIEKACEETGTRLISFGYENMESIKMLDKFWRVYHGSYKENF